MVKSGSHRSNARRDVLGNVVALVDAGSFVSQSGSHLVDQDGSRQSTTTDERALLARDGAIVADDGQAEGLGRVGNSVLLLGETEQENVSSAAQWSNSVSSRAHREMRGTGVDALTHDHRQDSLVVVDEVDGLADLANIRRCKDVTADGSREETVTDKAGVCKRKEGIVELSRLRDDDVAAGDDARAGSCPEPPPEICRGCRC